MYHTDAILPEELLNSIQFRMERNKKWKIIKNRRRRTVVDLLSSRAMIQAWINGKLRFSQQKREKKTLYFCLYFLCCCCSLLLLLLLCLLVHENKRHLSLLFSLHFTSQLDSTRAQSHTYTHRITNRHAHTHIKLLCYLFIQKYTRERSYRRM